MRVEYRKFNFQDYEGCFHGKKAFKIKNHLVKNTSFWLYFYFAEYSFALMFLWQPLKLIISLSLSQLKYNANILSQGAEEQYCANMTLLILILIHLQGLMGFHQSRYRAAEFLQMPILTPICLDSADANIETDMPSRIFKDTDIDTNISGYMI